MADISRNDRALVQGDPELRVKWLAIQINERKNQLKQLDVLLDKILTVEIKQLELKKDEVKKEIISLQNELDRQTIIEIDISNDKEIK